MRMSRNFYRLPTRPRRQTIATLRGGVVVVVVVACAAVLIALVAHGSAPFSVFSAPTATALPTATTDPALLAHNFTSTVNNNDLSLREDMAAMGRACGAVTASTASTWSTCNAAIQTVENTMQSFQDELTHAPAPPCFHAVDTTLRHAFVVIQQGSQDATNGVTAQDASEVNQGITLYTQASTQLITAMNEIYALYATTCSGLAHG